MLASGSPAVPGVCAHEICVVVHLRHVIDYYRDSSALPIIQDTIEKRWIPCAEEAGKHRDCAELEPSLENAVHLALHAGMIAAMLDR